MAQLAETDKKIGRDLLGAFGQALPLVTIDGAQQFAITPPLGAILAGTSPEGIRRRYGRFLRFV